MKFKRILSAVLCVLMLTSSFVFTANAAGETGTVLTTLYSSAKGTTTNIYVEGLNYDNIQLSESGEYTYSKILYKDASATRVQISPTLSNGVYNPAVPSTNGFTVAVLLKRNESFAEYLKEKGISETNLYFVAYDKDSAPVLHTKNDSANNPLQTYEFDDGYTLYVASESDNVDYLSSLSVFPYSNTHYNQGTTHMTNYFTDAEHSDESVVDVIGWAVYDGTVTDMEAMAADIKTMSLGTNIYVSPTGVNTYSGFSPSAPVKTLSQANTLIQNCLKADIYDENTTVTIHVMDGFDATHVVFKSDTGSVTLPIEDGKVTINSNLVRDISEYDVTFAKMYNVTVTGGKAEPATVEHGANVVITINDYDANAKTYTVTVNNVATDVVIDENGKFTLTNITEVTNVVISSTAQTRTVSVVADPTEGGTVSGLENEGVYNVGATVTLTAVPEEGYKFLYWTESDEEVLRDATISFTATANRNLVAVFEEITYTVTVIAGDGGEVEELASATVRVGTEVTINATPDEAYSFDGWYDGDEKVSSDAEYTFTVNDDVSLTAKFTKKTCTVSVTGGTPAESTVEYGDDLEITIPDYDANANTYTITVNNEPAEVTVSAEGKFTLTNITETTTVVISTATQTRTVTVNVDPTEGGTVDGAGVYNYGADVTVTATANEGYDFVSWTKDGEEVSTSAEFTFTANANVTLTANFKPLTFSVIFYANGGSGAPDSIEVKYGEEVDLSEYIPTLEGSDFAGWEDLESENPITITDNKFTMPAKNVTLTAKFTKKTYTVTFDAGEGKFANGESTYVVENVEHGKDISTLVPTETPEKASNETTNFKFDGWDYEIGATVVGETVISAKYEETTRTYGVTFYPNYDGGVENVENFYAYNAIIDNAPEFTRTGYTFAGWATDANGSKLETLPAVTGEAVYYALWTINQYEVKFVAEDQEVITKTVDHGKTVDVLPEAPEYDHKTFSKWMYAGAEFTTDIEITESITVEALYISEELLTVSFETLYGGPLVDVEDYAGETIELATLEHEGYTFEGWFDGGTKVSSPYTITKTVTLTAKFFENIAKIGDTNYPSLEAAVAAADPDAEVVLLKDASGNGIVINKDITINLGGNTYTIDGETVGSAGTETLGFQLLKNNNIKIENGTIKSSIAKMLVQNYSNLTLDGVTLDGSELVQSEIGYYTLSNCNGNVVIKNSTIIAHENGVAFDVDYQSSYPSGVKVTLTGTTEIIGAIEYEANEKNSLAKEESVVLEAPEGYEWNDEGVLVVVKVIEGETNIGEVEISKPEAPDENIKIEVTTPGEEGEDAKPEISITLPANTVVTDKIEKVTVNDVTEDESKYPDSISDPLDVKKVFEIEIKDEDGEAVYDATNNEAIVVTIPYEQQNSDRRIVIYHDDVRLTQVDSLADLEIGYFYYDAEAKEVTINVAHFSIITIVEEDKNDYILTIDATTAYDKDDTVYVIGDTVTVTIGVKSDKEKTQYAGISYELKYDASVLKYTGTNSASNGVVYKKNISGEDVVIGTEYTETFKVIGTFDSKAFTVIGSVLENFDASWEPQMNAPVEGPATIYFLEPYTITYENMDGATHEEGYPTKHTYGTATVLKDATKTGYTFDGWYADAGFTGNEVTELAADGYTAAITLYAKWTVNKYNVTFNADGGTTVDDMTDVPYGTEVDVSRLIPTKTGYTFAGWVDTATDDAVTVTEGKFAMPDRAVALKATWDLVEYSVSYTHTSGSTGDIADIIFANAPDEANIENALEITPVMDTTKYSYAFQYKIGDGDFTDIPLTDGKLVFEVGSVVADVYVDVVRTPLFQVKVYNEFVNGYALVIAYGNETGAYTFDMNSVEYGMYRTAHYDDNEEITCAHAFVLRAAADFDEEDAFELISYDANATADAIEIKTAEPDLNEDELVGINDVGAVYYSWTADETREVDCPDYATYVERLLNSDLDPDKEIDGGDVTVVTDYTGFQYSVPQS